MAGFSNNTMYADNVAFDGGKAPTVTTNGQLLIGSTASPNIRVGSLTSTGGTVTISTGAGTINLEAGATTPTTFTTDSGSATPAANILNLLGSGSITTSAVGNTVTTALTGLTNHAVLVGAGTSTITKLAVGTNGQVLIGAAGLDPAFSTLTSADSSITFTTGANTLDLVVAGGATVGKTITGDSGGALVPSSGNWTIAGGPGVTTSGSGSTLTINSVVFTDQGGSTSVTSDSGSFATAAITLTLPASPAQGEVCIFACSTANALVVDAPGTQLIRIGNAVSSAGGTATSTAIGDSLTLRYMTSTTTWIATSSMGAWTLA